MMLSWLALAYAGEDGLRVVLPDTVHLGEPIALELHVTCEDGLQIWLPDAAHRRRGLTVTATDADGRVAPDPRSWAAWEQGMARRIGVGAQGLVWTVDLTDHALIDHAGTWTVHVRLDDTFPQRALEASAVVEVLPPDLGALRARISSEARPWRSLAAPELHPLVASLLGEDPAVDRVLVRALGDDPSAWASERLLAAWEDPGLRADAKEPLRRRWSRRTPYGPAPLRKAWSEDLDRRMADLARAVLEADERDDLAYAAAVIEELGGPGDSQRLTLALQRLLHDGVRTDPAVGALVQAIRTWPPGWVDDDDTALFLDAARARAREPSPFPWPVDWGPQPGVSVEPVTP
ncbi:MAG: hypothetical protein H6738_09630 [Alphaproteobacteria bacterium]|nr:hypothetical protein [Alphaproteobacteria bacterium]